MSVYPAYIVTFSNRTGHGSWHGPMIAVPDVADVVTGIDERGALAGVDAVLAGYLGSVDAGQVVLDAAAPVELRNPDVISPADPVMGGVEWGFYTRPGIPELFCDYVVAVADVVTPNLFELQYLVGHETGTLSEVVEVARELRDRSPEIVVMVSVVTTDAPDGLLRMLAVDAGQIWLVETPMLECSLTGSDNLTAAMFFAHWLCARDLGKILGITISVVYSVLEQTSIGGEVELQPVAAQEQVVNPVNRFVAHSL